MTFLDWVLLTYGMIAGAGFPIALHFMREAKNGLDREYLRGVSDGWSVGYRDAMKERQDGEGKPE